MGERTVWKDAVHAGGAAVLLLLACGETRSNPSHETGGGRGAVAAGGASANGAGVGNAAANPSGGAAGSMIRLPDVDYGACVFEDPNVQLLVGYQILQEDEKDGPKDGSTGPDDVKRLDVSQPIGALGGIECLKNLEYLSLSVYGAEAPPVKLSSLGKLSKLRELRLYGPFVLDDALGEFALESLTLMRAHATSLVDVSKANGLLDVWLRDLPLASLDGIEQLSQLKKLRVENTPLGSLEPLGKTSGLEELTLFELPSLTSIAGIEPHLGLRSLHLSEVPLTSLEPLAKASQLGSVIVWTSALTSLAGLEDKPKLSRLDVTNAHVSDITALNGLPSLSYVDLAGNQIESLSPLAASPKIDYLQVSANRITSLAPVANLAMLESLQAGGNLLEAIDVDLPATLTSLHLSYNPITSLQPLAGLPLTYLAIASTKVTNLAVLADLPQLRTLNADDLGVTNLEVFPLARLQSLSARDNHVSDVAPLAGLGDLSVDLSNNDVVSLDAAFVGPASECGGLTLIGNPLDTAAQARLAWLCEQKLGAYAWDGGRCAFCIVTK